MSNKVTQVSYTHTHTHTHTRVCVCVFSHLVVSDSLEPRGLQSTGLCPCDFPGKNTGIGCHFLFQGIFLTMDRNSISCIGRWVQPSFYKRPAGCLHTHWTSLSSGVGLLKERAHSISHTQNRSKWPMSTEDPGKPSAHVNSPQPGLNPGPPKS